MSIQRTMLSGHERWACTECSWVVYRAPWQRSTAYLEAAGAHLHEHHMTEGGSGFAKASRPRKTMGSQVS